jgi:hypothetical protein
MWRPWTPYQGVPTNHIQIHCCIAYLESFERPAGRGMLFTMSFRAICEAVNEESQISELRDYESKNVRGALFMIHPTEIPAQARSAWA